MIGKAAKQTFAAQNDGADAECGGTITVWSSLKRRKEKNMNVPVSR